MRKYNLILNITTFCNYKCSYCDVIKNNKNLKLDTRLQIINFIKNNCDNINIIKFFWWEPLLAFYDIQYIVDNTVNYIWNNYEIVTNTSILTDEIGEYFRKYFRKINFSIDSENDFDYKKVFIFIKEYNLEEKLYFNLIISPNNEYIAYEQYQLLYKYWSRNFNILPIYYTKIWSVNNLKELATIIKKILWDYLINKDINLSWFQDNSWYNESLINESIFIDVDWKIYFSDLVSTNLWQNIKNKLFLWNLNNIDIWNINLGLYKNYLNQYETNIMKRFKWQKRLHEVMDYFSKYLNEKQWIIKD